MASDYTGISNNRGKCRIRWSENGVRRSKVLDIAFTPAGVKEAYLIKSKIERGYRQGLIIDVDGRPPTPTFYQVAQQMLNTTKHRPGTRRTTLIHLNKYWMPYFQDIAIDKISTPMIRHHLAELLLTKSPKYSKNILSSGSTVFDRALEDEFINSNPVAPISRKIKIVKALVDPFTPDERNQILDSLGEDHQILFYKIRFYMGLRPGEVIALKWSDYRNGEIYVTKTKDRGVVSPPKNNLERSVPVHPVVKEALKGAVRNLKNDHIILNQHGVEYSSPYNLAAAFSTVQAALGIRYRSPYNARHTCASMMLKAGMEPSQCAEYLGHTQQMFFGKYAKLIRDAKGDKEQARLWANAE